MPPVTVKTRVYWRDELGRFARAVDEGAEQAIAQATNRGAFLSQVFAPKRTGRLAGAISKNIQGTRGSWESGHEVYMIAQDTGAVEHEIGAAGQILANRGDGFGPVRGPILHPGNPATHYIKRSFDIIQAGLTALVQSKMP